MNRQVQSWCGSTSRRSAWRSAARLTDPQLRRLLDSTDVCQSVLGNFFGRAVSGQFDINDPKQLIGLLVTMARNRITNHALEQQAARRDHRRHRLISDGRHEPVDPQPGPGSAAEGRDLLEAVRASCHPKSGRSPNSGPSGNAWADIGAKIGAGPTRLRVRLGRAFDRVRRELRLIK